ILTSHLRSFLSVLAYHDGRYRIRERALAAAARVARVLWRRARESVDPAFLAWLGIEMAKGIEEGWTRGHWNGDGAAHG
ncbi:MAG: hypothetical protein Q9196_002383, partial [Gyalolechia fulgens]